MPPQPQLQRPSLLTPDADPYDVLCRHFNVAPPVLPPNTGPDLPPTIAVSILRSTHVHTYRPTHILAVSPSSPSPSLPVPLLLLPISAALYTTALRVDLPLPATPTPPTPAASTPDTLVLPLLPLNVPHPPTLALLLLFALSLEPSPHTALAHRLLPPAAVQEFPNSAAMAQALARPGSARGGFVGLVGRNEGLWKNVLALGVRERGVVDVVGMVWGVTAEARRVRARVANAAAAGGR